MIYVDGSHNFEHVFIDAYYSVQLLDMGGVVLFDDSIEDRATFDDPTELPTGVRNVWVAGEPIVTDGQVTGRLPGRVLGQ